MTTQRWIPKTDAERLDRLEALADIRQLPVRYAKAVDSRNLDDLVALFVPDVRVGKNLTGRKALRDWFANILSNVWTSVHFVGNHVFDLDAPDSANGVVYCRDELERPTDWGIGYLQYWDRYVKRDGEWLFERRQYKRWFMVDALTRPSHGAGLEGDRQAIRSAGLLPDAYESWAKFWANDAVSPNPWTNKR